MARLLNVDATLVENAGDSLPTHGIERSPLRATAIPATRCSTAVVAEPSAASIDRRLADRHQADIRILGIEIVRQVLKDSILERLAVVSVCGREGLGDGVAVDRCGAVGAPVVEHLAADGVGSGLNEDLNARLAHIWRDHLRGQISHCRGSRRSGPCFHPRRPHSGRQYAYRQK